MGAELGRQQLITADHHCRSSLQIIPVLIAMPCPCPPLPCPGLLPCPGPGSDSCQPAQPAGGCGPGGQRCRRSAGTHGAPSRQHGTQPGGGWGHGGRWEGRGGEGVMVAGGRGGEGKGGGEDMHKAGRGGSRAHAYLRRALGCCGTCPPTPLYTRPTAVPVLLLPPPPPFPPV